MKLRHRLLKGFTRPLPEVDKTLTNQGFKRIDGKPLEYQLVLTDLVTRSSYYLRIPCYPVESGEGEQVRLGIPYLIKRHSSPSFYGREEIPFSVRKAAEEKAAEVFTYLASRRIPEKSQQQRES